MSIINSNTTGHNRSKEISFSKKLFMGLGALIVVAMAFFVLMGQKKELSTSNPQAPATSEAAEKSGDTNTDSKPTPVSEQPKN